MSCGPTVRNPNIFYPPADSVIMNKLMADLQIEIKQFVKYLNLNFSYGIRRAMKQELFNTLLHRNSPIEYHERHLYQVIFACECRSIPYAIILAITKNFISVVDEVRETEIYETETA